MAFLVRQLLAEREKKCDLLHTGCLTPGQDSPVDLWHLPSRGWREGVLKQLALHQEVWESLGFCISSADLGMEVCGHS